MAPSEIAELPEVLFLQTTGELADAIRMPGHTLVPVEVAYAAAVRFLRGEAPPQNVQWLEL